MDAYILVQTEVGKAGQIAREVAGIKGVLSAEDVTGPYDVIVRAEARTLDDLSRRPFWSPLFAVTPGVSKARSTMRKQREKPGITAGLQQRP